MEKAMQSKLCKRDSRGVTDSCLRHIVNSEEKESKAGTDKAAHTKNHTAVGTFRANPGAASASFCSYAFNSWRLV